MSKINYYTEKGIQKLKDEIDHLERVERPKLSALIGAAIDLGDLSENAEYHAAKESQGLMEARISKLKNELSIARLIDDSQLAGVHSIKWDSTNDQGKFVSAGIYFFSVDFICSKLFSTSFPILFLISFFLISLSLIFLINNFLWASI